MTEAHIITGFLGAGKTTFLNKLLREGGADGGTVLVENEFGDISVDGDCLPAEIQVMEIASGCICCSLQGNFVDGLAELCARYSPRQILIEPTGMANLKDTLTAAELALEKIGGRLGAVITVVAADTLPALLMVGGDFFRLQLEQARYILLSGTQNVDGEELTECLSLLRELNPAVPVRSEPWEELDALSILEEAAAVSGICQENPSEGNARPEGITSRSFLPGRNFTLEEAEDLLSALESGAYGRVLRAKGFLRSPGGGMLHLEYVFGGRSNVTPSAYEGPAKFVVIGSLANHIKLGRLFRYNILKS